MMKLNKWLLTLMLAAGIGMTLAAAEAAPEARATETAPGDRAAECSECSWGKAGRFALLYLPNLIQDAVDVFSVRLGFGPIIACDVYATRYMEFGGEAGYSWFIGKGVDHQWGGGLRDGKRFGLFCFAVEDVYVSRNFGWMGSYALVDEDFSVPERTGSAYREGLLDFWAVGAHAALLLDVAIELHPIAVADFFCGIVGYDLSSDNWK